MFAPLLLSFAAATFALWSFTLIMGVVYRSAIKNKVNKVLGRAETRTSGNKLWGKRVSLKDDRTKWRFINNFNTTAYLSEREKQIVSAGIQEVQEIRKISADDVEVRQLLEVIPVGKEVLENVATEAVEVLEVQEVQNVQEEQSI